MPFPEEAKSGLFSKVIVLHSKILLIQYFMRIVRMDISYLHHENSGGTANIKPLTRWVIQLDVLDQILPRSQKASVLPIGSTLLPVCAL